MRSRLQARRPGPLARTPRGRAWRVALGALLLALSARAALSADAPGLRDGDLQEWRGGVPVHWQVGVGARNGDGPVSRVGPAADGGVRLFGDASTGVWALLSQRFPTKAGATYRLSFEVRAKDLRREANQFDNAYAGVRLAAESGPPDLRIEVPWRPAWTPAECVFRGTGRDGEAVVFLSKSGTLEARRFVLETLEAKDAFDVLVRDVRRYYAQFAVRPDVDWPSLVERARATFPADGNEREFVPAAVAMLGALEDPHVWIRTSDGRTVPTWAPRVVPNADFRAVGRALADVRRIGKAALAGRVGDDVGYVAVGSLALGPADAAALGAAWRDALGRRALMIDLRGNGGGDEARAADLVAPLVDRPRPYARRRVRIGPDPADLSEPMEAWIRPAGGAPFAGPVVVLIGPACMSAGEGMAQMLRALPGVTFVGAPTRGASGNPAPVDLPNGVPVWFSRWVDEMPDGTVLEKRGVRPDVAVDFPGPSPAEDPVFLAGLRILRERLSR